MPESFGPFDSTMSEVSYTRPWLLYLYVAYGAAIVSIPAAISGVTLGAPRYFSLIIFAAFLAVGVSVLRFWKAYSKPTEFERGRQARFIGPQNRSPQFRVYDDFLLVREFDGFRIRTTRYSYDEALEVECRPTFWRWPRFGGRVVLRLRDKNGQRTVDVWSTQAEEIADAIAEAKRTAKRADLPATVVAANPVRRTPTTAVVTNG